MEAVVLITAMTSIKVIGACVGVAMGAATVTSTLTSVHRHLVVMVPRVAMKSVVTAAFAHPAIR